MAFAVRLLAFATILHRMNKIAQGFYAAFKAFAWHLAGTSPRFGSVFYGIKRKPRKVYVTFKVISWHFTGKNPLLLPQICVE